MEDNNLVMCRICLRTDRNLDGANEDLVDFHDEICGYEVATIDPKYCWECRYLLKKLFAFKNKCVQACRIVHRWRKTKMPKTPLNQLYAMLPPSNLDRWLGGNNTKIYDISHCGNKSLPSTTYKTIKIELDFDTGPEMHSAPVLKVNLPGDPFLEPNVPKDLKTKCEPVEEQVGGVLMENMARNPTLRGDTPTEDTVLKGNMPLSMVNNAGKLPKPGPSDRHVREGLSLKSECLDFGDVTVKTPKLEANVVDLGVAHVISNKFDDTIVKIEETDAPQEFGVVTKLDARNVTTKSKVTSNLANKMKLDDTIKRDDDITDSDHDITDNDAVSSDCYDVNQLLMIDYSKDDVKMKDQTDRLKRKTELANNTLSDAVTNFPKDTKGDLCEKHEILKDAGQELDESYDGCLEILPDLPKQNTKKNCKRKLAKRELNTNVIDKNIDNINNFKGNNVQSVVNKRSKTSFSAEDEQLKQTPSEILNEVQIENDSDITAKCTEKYYATYDSETHIAHDSVTQANNAESYSTTDPQIQNEAHNSVTPANNAEGYSTTDPQIQNEAHNANDSLIPVKSREKYVTAYDTFLQWKRKKKAQAFSENVFMAYFTEIADTYKPSSLWCMYSMLRTMVRLKHGVDIKTYNSLMAFLRGRSDGYIGRKCKVLSPADVEKFLKKAPDSQYLATKVALIFGVTGACRRHELYNITTKDVESRGEMIHVKISPSKNRPPRSFTIQGTYREIVDRYQGLRSTKTKSDRFFQNFQKGKCTAQTIGINKFGNMPKVIAKYLGLPEAEYYTGHSFRKTSATMLAESDAELLTLERDGGWCSDAVADSYMDDSILSDEVSDEISEVTYLEPKAFSEPQPSSSSKSYLVPASSDFYDVPLTPNKTKVQKKWHAPM